MFKGLGDIASLMKQAGQIQGKMQEMQESLGQIRVEGSAGGGMVRVESTGQQKIVGITIEESLLDSSDREMLEDLIVAATNQALDKAREAAAEQMQNVAGGINIPGLGDALSKFGAGENPAPSGE